MRNCLTMISKRVEDGETVDVRARFDGTVQMLAEVRAELAAAVN